MPTEPGMVPEEGRGAVRGRAVQALVLISAVWLALAGLIGLIAALVRSWRTTSPQQASAPDPGRTAQSDDRPARPVLYGCLFLILAVACAVVVSLVYVYFNDHLETANVTASTNSLGHGEQVTLTDPGDSSGVRWSMMPGQVERLTVDVPGPGLAEVMLPLRPSLCPAMASMLKVKCRGDTVVSVNSPVEFAWSHPHLLNSAPGGEAASTVNIQSAATADGAQTVIMSPTGDAIPSLCFGSALTSAKLTVTIGRYSFPHGFTGPQIVPCGQGITVLVGSRGNTPPVFELDGIAGLMLSASGPVGTLQGFTGQIALMPGGTTPLGSSSTVSLTAQQAAGLTASVMVAPGTQSFAVTSEAANSVVSDGSQLLPSQWAERNDILVPLLGAVVTAGVVTPLGVSMGVLTDAVKRWPGPSFRRGRRSMKKEARHAP